MEDAPRYRTLPARTTSFNASSVSSIGVAIVEAVQLIEVDIVGPKTPEAAVDCIEDMLARQAAIVDVAAHRMEEFCRDHQLVAWNKV